MKTRGKTFLVGVGVAAVMVCLGGCSSTQATQSAEGAVRAQGPADVPSQLQVPSGNKVVADLHGVGVQTYDCSNGKWTLLEPAAVLSKENGEPVALHTRGPEWVSIHDGSALTGSTVASVNRQGAVPELLLKSSGNRGDGLFGNVDYVQRLDTHGGVAPQSSCTAGHQVGVPYSATYVFYAPAS